MYHKNKKSLIKKILVITAVFTVPALVLLTLEMSGLVNLYKNSPENSDPATSDESNSSPINFNPPTDEEKAAGDLQKDKISENQNSTSELASEAEIVIVDASQYGDSLEVRAFVANIIEDGECTISFEKNGTVIEKSVHAFADATTTPCMTLNMPAKELPTSGSWNVTVTYKNEDIIGTAQSIIKVEY